MSRWNRMEANVIIVVPAASCFHADIVGYVVSARKALNIIPILYVTSCRPEALLSIQNEIHRQVNTRHEEQNYGECWKNVFHHR